MRRIPIVQGEYAVAAEPGVVISTLLGSCVAVCLQDPVARIGGMNHFLLAEPGPNQDVHPDDMQRYGVHAMELLINAMMHRGASRTRLRANLYGGANVVPGFSRIGSSNAAFARQFMQTEAIEIGRCDLEGTHPRKVEFMPYEGRIRSMLVHRPPPIEKPVAEAAGGDVELF